MFLGWLNFEGDSTKSATALVLGSEGADWPLHTPAHLNFPELCENREPAPRSSWFQVAELCIRICVMPSPCSWSSSLQMTSDQLSPAAGDSPPPLLRGSRRAALSVKPSISLGFTVENSMGILQKIKCGSTDPPSEYTPKIIKSGTQSNVCAPVHSFR